MKDKRLYKTWTGISRVLAVIGTASMTVWLLHYVTEPAYEGHDVERFVREMLISTGLIFASVLADNVAAWYSDKVRCVKSIVRQEWQRRELCMEDIRMKTNINVR